MAPRHFPVLRAILDSFHAASSIVVSPIIAIVCGLIDWHQAEVAMNERSELSESSELGVMVLYVVNWAETAPPDPRPARIDGEIATYLCTVGSLPVYKAPD
jgi:hypothetical protein